MEAYNQYSLAGCVVLYNPDNTVVTNIDTYIQYLDVLYVVDNSEQPDNNLIAEIEQLSPKINYIKQSENLGIATALNTAAALTAKINYNWLLTMDQDSYFLSGTFFDNWKCEVRNNNKIGVIAASYTNERNRWQQDFSENYIETHYAVTSGNIINVKIWEEAGGFEDKLFIDEVDHDYCLKVRQLNYKIITSKVKLMQHAIGEYHDGAETVLKKGVMLKLHSPLRYYYMSRNVLYVCKKYFYSDFKFASSRFYYLLKMLAKIILVYPDKSKYLKFFFRGIGDFFAGRYNKYIN